MMLPSSFGLFVAIQNPGVLAAAALRRVDDERPLAQRDPGQAAGNDGNPLARQYERTQVNMSSLEFTIAKRRVLREINHRLRNVIARLGDDQLAEFFDFFF